MRLLILQFNGDYREAFNRFEAGAGETYYAQKYSVDMVDKLGQQVEQIGVLCCITAESYDEVLSNGVRAIGAGFQGAVDFEQIVQRIEQFQPTHLILNTPVRRLLNWAIQHRIPTLAILADSFEAKSPKTHITNFLLARKLNHPQIQWIGNHGVPAAQALQKIGVNPNKIIPWDWPHRTSPEAFPAKTLSVSAPENSSPLKLVYVGTISEAKGVGDAIRAVSRLKAQNFPVTLQIAGRGEIAAFEDLVQKLDIADRVNFLGLVENHRVIELMRSADLVLVPSRPEYPEGFPMTIYEALCSRTPIVASNHPMFIKRLRHRTNALIFSAGDETALANCIQDLLTDPDLYQQISQASLPTWKNLQLPVQWGDFIQRWLNGSATDQQWLYQQRLASGQYDAVR